MIDARKILKTIIEGLDTKMYISKVEPIYDVTFTLLGYKLYSCDTLALAEGKTFYYAGAYRTITDMVMNEYVYFATGIVIADPYPNSAITPNIFFYSTKLRDGSTERAIKNLSQKHEVPFVWIREPYQNTTQDEFQSYENWSIDMYLLDDCYMVGQGKGVGGAWDTQTHHEQVINPLMNLYKGRLKTAITKNYKYISDWQNETVRGLAFVEEEVNKSLFEEKLSGVNVRIDLHFNIQGCKCVN